LDQARFFFHCAEPDKRSRIASQKSAREASITWQNAPFCAAFQKPSSLFFFNLVTEKALQKEARL
jgi:hypothetical protein